MHFLHEWYVSYIKKEKMPEAKSRLEARSLGPSSVALSSLGLEVRFLATWVISWERTPETLLLVEMLHAQADLHRCAHFRFVNVTMCGSTSRERNKPKNTTCN